MNPCKEVDLRSDTITKPPKEMLNAMLNAEVGDDFFGEDPTVKELEEYACKLFGKESALYFPTGTMGNLASILAHCWQRGQEVVLGDQSHIHLLEQGNISQFGNIHVRTIKNFPDGTFCLDELKSKLRKNTYCQTSCLFSSSSLICIENTHNMCSGGVLPLSFIKDVKEIAEEYNLKLHMDGARVLNAAIHLKVDPKLIVQDVDSVSVCLSKGLCCPIGTVVLGDKDFITRVHRIRKGLGGGMRQIGYMAACGLYALKHMINRLEDDHRRAFLLAESIVNNNYKYFTVNLNLVQTNIVFIDCKKNNANELVKRLSIITDEEKKFFNNDACVVKMFVFSENRVRYLTSAVCDDESIRLAVLKINFVINEFEKEIN